MLNVTNLRESNRNKQHHDALVLDRLRTTPRDTHSVGWAHRYVRNTRTNIALFKTELSTAADGRDELNRLWADGYVDPLDLDLTTPNSFQPWPRP